MEAGSRSYRSFMDDDNFDDDDFGKLGFSSKDLEMRRDHDQKPCSPRSKHSATEQRRRSRINERFRVLRDLIPDSDQKIDKASFLLKVIEYIQTLQEKVLKYEMSYPANGFDSEKLIPWKNNQGPGDASVRKCNPTAAETHASMTMSSTQDVCTVEDFPSSMCGKEADPAVLAQYDSTTSQKGGYLANQSLGNELNKPDTVLGPRKCSIEGCGDDGVSNRQEGLVITEGTISLTCTYSDRFFTAFEKALQDLGVDLSQASLSVLINLARQQVAWPSSIPEEMEGQGPVHQSTSHARKEDPGVGRGKRQKSDSGQNDPLSPSLFPLSANDHSPFQ